MSRSGRPTRVKFLMREVDERAGASNRPLLSVSASRGVVLRSELTSDEPRADDLGNYKVCRAGDLVINRMSAYQGALGIARQDGIVSPDYSVLRLTGDVMPSFAHHLFRSSWFVSEMTARLRGIGGSDQGNVRTPRINTGDLGQIVVPLPGTELQREIGTFLDAETARIDALIEKKRRVTELVHERWRATLTDKFNGRDGLRLKYMLASPLAYGVLVPEHDPDGVPMLRITDLRGGAVDLERVARIPERQALEYRRTRVSVGDLVVSIVGTLGRAVVVTPALAGCNLSRALARVSVRSDVPRSLVRLWFQSDLFLDQARLATSSDSAQPALGLGDLKNFALGIPSDAREWQRLAEEVEAAEQDVRRLESCLSAQINLLHQRRQALITAAVTGELDVAAAA
jgi:type I restriction enzyme, S subunit